MALGAAASSAESDSTLFEDLPPLTQEVYNQLALFGFEPTTVFRTPGFTNPGLLRDDMEITTLDAGQDGKLDLFISLPLLVDRTFPWPPGFFFRFMAANYGYLGARVQIDSALPIALQINGILDLARIGNAVISRNRQFLLQYTM